MNETPNQTVANSGKTPYSRSGGDSMVEPAQEGGKPMGVDDATQRLEEAARLGEQRRQERARERARQESQAAEGDNADGGKKPPETPPTPPNADNSGGRGGEPPRPPPVATGSAGEEQPPEFKDPRLRDIAREVADLLEEGQGADADFLKEREDRIDRILDDREFVDEVARDQAKALKKSLINLRVVPSEGQTAFKRELGGISAKTDFQKMNNFIDEALRTPIRNYEQLEGVHRRLGRSYNEEASGIVQDFIKQGKDIQERINEEAKVKGVAPRVLSDAERDQLAEAFRGRMKSLRDTRQSVIDSLEKNFGSARKGLTADQQTLIGTITRIEESIDDLNRDEALDENTKNIQESELRKELRDTVLALTRPIAPENEPLPDEILIAIGKDNFATEEFLDRLIRLAQENAPYRLPGFYSDINLNKFLKLNENAMDSDRMERLLNLVRATETLHEMNRILKTSIDQFAQISQTILPEHLTTVFRVRGVQDVFSLYEGIIKEQESIETMITDDVFNRIDKQVEEEFMAGIKKRINRNGKEDHLTQSFRGEGEMEDWEVKRAISYGRNLMRTLLREGEYISASYIPEAQRAFISLAQGQLVGVFNPVTYTFQRFEPGKPTGGSDLLEAFLDEGVEKRRHGRNNEESKGIVRIRNLQGTRVRDREATKLVNARGNIMTWRATEAILEEIAILDNGSPSNITKFFRDHAREISALREISSSNAWENEFRRAKGEIKGTHYNGLEEWKRARIEQVFSPLLENSAVAQGALVSSLPLAMPTEVKKMLWERISDLNPDVMASFLTRLEIDGGAEGADKIKGVKSLEEILLDSFGTPEQRQNLLSPDGRWKLRLVEQELGELKGEHDKLEVKVQDAKSQSEKGKWREQRENKGIEYDAKKREFESLDGQVKILLRGKEWTSLRRKLRMINRLRMLDETGRINSIKTFQSGETSMDSIRPPKKFKEYLDDPRFLDEDRLTEGERKVVDAVSQNGKKIAQDLANIQQATVWFLDDVPTDIIRWENLGQSFNRMINDFAQFAQSGGEIGGFLLDPFKMDTSKAMEHQVKAIQAAGQVLGVDAAQDNMNDLIMKYDEWCMEYPRYRQVIISSILGGADKYTSKAQELSRDTGAPSRNESVAYDNLLTENHLGITRKEKRDKNGKIEFTDLFKKAEKKLRIGVLNRFVWANIRDWGPFFLLGLLIQLFKETTADTKR